MLRIRLRRVGKKKQPMYRIVVADSRAPRDGAFVESIGYYQPLDDPSTIVINAERARMWLERGAQPSERVAKLFAIQSIMELPPKLKARIELVKQQPRAPKKAKPEATAPAALAAQAATPAAPATEAAAPAPAEAEAPVAEEPAPAEEPATEEPPQEAETTEEQPEA
jgi:small subunit ribosomal protein S16